jgi:hypothetical protein
LRTGDVIKTDVGMYRFSATYSHFVNGYYFYFYLQASQMQTQSECWREIPNSTAGRRQEIDLRQISKIIRLNVSFAVPILKGKSCKGGFIFNRNQCCSVSTIAISSQISLNNKFISFLKFLSTSNEPSIAHPVSRIIPEH